jgi:hypothetical protein
VWKPLINSWSMKKISLSVFLIVLLHPVFAQKSERAVEYAVEKLRLAMIDGNKIILGEIASEQLSYGHSGGHVDDKKEFVEKIVSGRSDFVSIRLSEQKIIVSKKTAIVRHRLDAVTNDNGNPGEVHLLVMLVWQKQEGSWKLLARQAIKAP